MKFPNEYWIIALVWKIVVHVPDPIAQREVVPVSSPLPLSVYYLLTHWKFVIENLPKFSFGFQFPYHLLQWSNIPFLSVPLWKLPAHILWLLYSFSVLILSAVLPSDLPEPHNSLLLFEHLPYPFCTVLFFHGFP